MAKKRQLDDWIIGYLKYIEHTEPPVGFHVWSALSTISSALQRKCFMKWGHETIYPNQYIIFVGESGATRKSTALQYPREFLSKIDSITLGPSAITREALIRLMSEGSTGFIDEQTNRPKTQCAITCISSELHVFLGAKEIRFLADLTDWYDSADSWSYETKREGRQSIDGVCINILGGTAPQWVSSMLPQEALGGGFTSRCVFVVESKKGKIVANPNKTPIDYDLRDALVADLEQISRKAGEYRFDGKAEALYEAWYIEQEEGIQKGRYPVKDSRFGGYAARRATHVKKMAMCITVSHSDNFIISAGDFNRARMILEATESKMDRAFQGVGRSPFAEIADTIIDFIAQKGEVTRTELLLRYYRDVDVWHMEQLETLFQQMGVIKVINDTTTSQIRYTYIGKRREESTVDLGQIVREPGSDETGSQ